MSTTLPLKSAWFPACVPPRDDPVAQASRMKMADSQIQVDEGVDEQVGWTGWRGRNAGRFAKGPPRHLVNHISTRLRR